MERSTPVRMPNTSTADLLTWSETPPAHSPAVTSAAYRSGTRSHQLSDRISKVVFGGQVTDEEFQSLNKRKLCSGYKMKEMTGSGIFLGSGENEDSEACDVSATPNNRTGIRMYQQAMAGISHISFAEEENFTSKKPISFTEVAKQRELSGTLESEDENSKKLLSDAKSKELSGHGIFASPPEILPRPSTRTLDLRGHIDIGKSTIYEAAGRQFNVVSIDEPLKTAKKIYSQKFNEISGNDIFNGNTAPSSAEKSLSMAKLREISGNDIFADGKVESRDYLGGVRKPPGGESSIALV